MKGLRAAGWLLADGLGRGSAAPATSARTGSRSGEENVQKVIEKFITQKEYYEIKVDFKD